MSKLSPRCPVNARVEPSGDHPCQYDPTLIASAAALLQDRTDHYLYVSSVGAYASYAQPNIDEGAPTRTFDGNEEAYSSAKAESERRLKAIVGNRLTVVCPNAIHGAKDVSPNILSWLLRAQRGGTHIGPGGGNDWHHPQIPWQDPRTPAKEQAVLNAWKSASV
jgi:hypothetical protein